MARFSYSLLRYVPDPSSGEFVNIGAVVGSDETNEWSYQLDGLNRARALARAYGRDAAAIALHAERFAELINDYQEALDDQSQSSPPVALSEQWLRNQASRMHNMLQLSKPNVLLADNADAALAKVFTTLIPEGLTRRHGQKKSTAISAARRAFLQTGLRMGRDILEGPEVSNESPARFDFAIANGKVVQLVQAWSFDVVEEDKLLTQIRAWAWSLEKLRGKGGRTRVGDRELEVPKDVSIATVYVPPVVEDNETFTEAKRAFNQLDVSAYPLDSVVPMANNAKSMLDAAHAH